MMQNNPILLSVEKIWDKTDHSGLTDLIKWKGDLWLIFRESDSHFGGENGILRLLKSSNGVIFELVTTFEWEGWDLRDPKLSVTPNGHLMLLTGGSRFNFKKERTAHVSSVAFSDNGKEWTPFQVILEEEWLWRITWFQGMGYGISYYFEDPSDSHSSWYTRLYKTHDGINYELMTDFSIPGKPNEATIRFFTTGEMVVLQRRDDLNKRAWIGFSSPPYEDWIWNQTSFYFGGPNFLIFPDENLWAAGRIFASSPYGEIERTVLARMDLKELEPVLTLPSLGDCSYPGMVYEHPFLWISYYSSHEGKSAIYLAKIAF